MGFYQPSFTSESEKVGNLPKAIELEGMELGIKPKDNQLPNSCPLTLLLPSPCPPGPCFLMEEIQGRWGPEPFPYKFSMPSYWSRPASNFGYAYLLLSFPLRPGAPEGWVPVWLDFVSQHISAARGLQVSAGTGEWIGKNDGEAGWMTSCLGWFGVGCFWKRCDFNANFGCKRERGWTHFL